MHILKKTLRSTSIGSSIKYSLFYAVTSDDDMHHEEKAYIYMHIEERERCGIGAAQSATRKRKISMITAIASRRQSGPSGGGV